MYRPLPSIGSKSCLWVVGWMYQVDVYLRVRRAVMVDGMSIREVSRVFGLHRDTVRKILPGRDHRGLRHSPSWAECPRASCTTTPSWRWPGYWGMDAVNAPGPLRNSSPTTCSRTGSTVPARATTRGRSRGWSAICGATSWCRSRPSRALMR